MEKKRYVHKKVEKKWQKIWEETKPSAAKLDPDKPKYYVLDMFPYPSGAGLHVGHVSGYTATDVMARFKRQMGYSVLHPMGWDSFGLPAEQYAIRTGTHPVETTKKNIDTYRRQLKSLGFSYDWDREVTTSDPAYYKWTQWIFTKLYEKELAYEADMMVNYCPDLGTVVANEEIEEGKTKEGGYPIKRVLLRQWMLKITAYADRLIEDLELMDWPVSLKKLQINWIGRSEGAMIYFEEPSTHAKIEVYTTRPDTLFGVSFLVLAPEHPLVDKVTTNPHKKSVDKYKKEVASKSDLARTDLNFAKSGVFTGGYAINPINDEQIPIWIADYVLFHVGTGAVMGVPGSDERDFAFVQKYGLPVLPVVCPEDKGEDFDQIIEGKVCFPHYGVVINSKNDRIDLDGLLSWQAKKQVTEYLEKNNLGKYQINYKLRDWLFSRQRYWGEPFPILHFADGTKRALDLDELPLISPELKDYLPTQDAKSPLAKVKDWIEITDPKTKKQAQRESNTMPQWAGSCWYYLRFCDPHNTSQAWSKETEQYWMPIDLYVGGAEHATLHLLYARFWHKVLFDCGLVKTPEPFTKFRHVGLVISPSYKDQKGRYFDPKEIIQKNGEYFSKEGDLLSMQIEKMSKSKLNGVTPDEIVEEFGADSLRLYELFMAPFDKEKVWNTDAIVGCYRFLHRFFEMATSLKVTDEVSVEGLKLGYRLVDQVITEIDKMQLNTAIAKIMEFLNAFVALPTYPKEVVKWAVQLLFPFAPHICSEIWEILGYSADIATLPYPEVDFSYLEDKEVNFIIQINGKHRGLLSIPKGADQKEVASCVEKSAIGSRYLTKKVQRIIFVPDKIINFVL